ncbi:hypothetical protein FQA39_LY01074 [Lamprigera yunnana]|nr:hypothetical protein FQA39_LY01074 [Lamprigera yunnana]
MIPSKPKIEKREHGGKKRTITIGTWNTQEVRLSTSNENQSVLRKMANQIEIKYEFEDESVKFLPHRLLASAGPVNVSARFISALSRPSLSSTSKEIYMVMQEIQRMLKYAFQTENEATFGILTSGTGAIEATLVNLVNPGEKILVAVAGLFGSRIAQIAKLRDMNVVEVTCKVGEAFSFEKLENAIIVHKPVILYIIHGESSTGILQPLNGLGEICNRHGCLLAIDAMSSVGSAPLFVDRWEIDVAVSACNKSLRGSGGFSYITLSPRAMAKIKGLQVKSPLYYDINNLVDMWNRFDQRLMHCYNLPSHFLFGARESLMEIVEEGLEAIWTNHKLTGERIVSAAKSMGCDALVKDPTIRLPSINVLILAPPLDVNEFISYVFKKYQVVVTFCPAEVSNCIRVGVMGYNNRPDVVDYVLQVLREALEFFKTNKYYK